MSCYLVITSVITEDTNYSMYCVSCNLHCEIDFNTPPAEIVLWPFCQCADNILFTPSLNVAIKA